METAVSTREDLDKSWQGQQPKNRRPPQPMKYSNQASVPSFSYAMIFPRNIARRTSTADNSVDPQLHKFSNFPFIRSSLRPKAFGGGRSSGDHCDAHLNFQAESYSSLIRIGQKTIWRIHHREQQHELKIHELTIEIQRERSNQIPLCYAVFSGFAWSNLVFITFSLRIEYHDRLHSTPGQKDRMHISYTLHKTCAAIRGIPDCRESTAERAQTSGVANGFDRLEM